MFKMFSVGVNLVMDGWFTDVTSPLPQWYGTSSGENSPHICRRAVEVLKRQLWTANKGLGMGLMNSQCKNTRMLQNVIKSLRLG
jgi:hypothetical protein